MSTNADILATSRHSLAPTRSPIIERRGYVDIDGLPIYVSETDPVDGLRNPSQPPLLLVMGIGASLRLWAPLRAALPNIATIAFDNPGAGASASTRFPKRMPGLAKIVVDLLDTMGYARVDVLGVSFGGALAQELAHVAPNRVRRLVLAATGPGLGGIPGRPSALLRMVTPRRFVDSDYLARVAPSLYGGRVREKADFADTLGSHLDVPTMRGYLWQLAAISGWTSMTYLHRLTQPTLVMGGDDDPIVPLINSRILAARIPNARLDILRGGGHLFLLDSVDVVAPAIASFLEQD